MNNNKVNFHIPYPRPKKLSDPCGDFSNCPDILISIIKKTDDHMDWRDYRCIFQVGLPAATYEEGIYFIPYAFEYIRGKPSDGYECIANLIWFISKHHSLLEKEGLLAQCYSAIRLLFQEWTQSFNVVRHFESNRPYVQNYHEAGEIIDSLIRFESCSDLARELLDSLVVQHDNPIKSAWLLTYIYDKYNHKQLNEKMDFVEMLKSIEHKYKEIVPSDESNSIMKSINNFSNTPETLEIINSIWKESKEYNFIHDLYLNKNLLGQHMKSVSQNLMVSDADNVYWGEVFCQLKLID